MIIKKRSMLTGVEHERDINVTEAQIELWQSGTHIQYAMPHLSDDDREFLMTGITKEEWDRIMRNNDSEED